MYLFVYFCISCLIDIRSLAIVAKMGSSSLPRCFSYLVIALLSGILWFTSGGLNSCLWALGVSLMKWYMAAWHKYKGRNLLATLD